MATFNEISNVDLGSFNQKSMTAVARSFYLDADDNEIEDDDHAEWGCVPQYLRQPDEVINY